MEIRTSEELVIYIEELEGKGMEFYWKNVFECFGCTNYTKYIAKIIVIYISSQLLDSKRTG